MKVKAYFEIQVEHKGCSYLVIYGEHINGGWCCIPNWGVGCEMGSTGDIQLNAEALERAGLNASAAKAIADEISAEGFRLMAQGQLPEYGQIGSKYLRRTLGELGFEPDKPVDPVQEIVI